MDEIAKLAAKVVGDTVILATVSGAIAKHAVDCIKKLLEWRNIYPSTVGVHLGAVAVSGAVVAGLAALAGVPVVPVLYLAIPAGLGAVGYNEAGKQLRGWLKK